MEISTAAGPARIELDEAVLADGGAARFLLVLTHGAGGGVDSEDLLAAREAGLACGGAVARVLQPYRVRGARAPGSAVRQDAAWLEVIGALRQRIRTAASPGRPEQRGAGRVPDGAGGWRRRGDRAGISAAPARQGRQPESLGLASFARLGRLACRCW